MYIHCTEIYNTKAPNIVVPILLKYVQPKSVLDVGCGTGTWLKVFNQAGVNDFFGVDGEDLAPNVLQVPKQNFSVRDFTQPLNLSREFDLVVSLEVAEHLPESAADVFIATLIKHSKIVLFSAAIPGQGGQNHLNEQWPSYWQEKFGSYGYKYYDLIRPKVWDNEEVDVWYRQNMFLVCHKSIKIDVEEYSSENLIHPKFWERKVDSEERLSEQLKRWQEGRVGIANSSKALRKSIKNFFHV